MFSFSDFHRRLEIPISLWLLRLCYAAAAMLVSPLLLRRLRRFYAAVASFSDRSSRLPRRVGR